MALIDNGRMVTALLLGWLFLQEAFTPAKLTDNGVMVVGLLVNRADEPFACSSRPACLLH